MTAFDTVRMRRQIILRTARNGVSSPRIPPPSLHLDPCCLCCPSQGRVAPQPQSEFWRWRLAGRGHWLLACSQCAPSCSCISAAELQACRRFPRFWPVTSTGLPSGASQSLPISQGLFTHAMEGASSMLCGRREWRDQSKSTPPNTPLALHPPPQFTGQASHSPNPSGVHAPFCESQFACWIAADLPLRRPCPQGT